MDVETFCQWVDKINIFIGIFVILVAISQAFIKNKKPINYVIILLYLSAGTIIITYSLEASGAIASYPHLIGIAWPLQPIVAATMYLYVKLLVSPTFSFKPKHLLFYSPGVLYFLFLIPNLYLSEAAEKIHVLSEYNQWKFLAAIDFVLYNLVSLAFVSLALYEMRIIFNKQRLKNLEQFRLVFVFLIVGVLAVVLYSISLFSESGLLMRVASLIMHLLLFVPFLLGFRYPNFMLELTSEISREKYKQSQVKGININGVVSRLTELMKLEKIFTDSELTINKLSEQLSISTHQLSEILNNTIEMNYAAYITSFRIEEAKRLLIKNPKESVLQIAYAVGFNSKTTFNTAFKKSTNLTPTEFRKKQQKLKN